MVSDNDTIKVDHIMEVSFKVAAYEDKVESDVVPMTVCHLLLRWPWQFDCGIIHNGRTNHYSFKWEGKEDVLCPMLPNQVITDKTLSGHAIGESSKGAISH